MQDETDSDGSSLLDNSRHAPRVSGRQSFFVMDPGMDQSGRSYKSFQSEKSLNLDDVFGDTKKDSGKKKGEDDADDDESSKNVESLVDGMDDKLSVSEDERSVDSAAEREKKIRGNMLFALLAAGAGIGASKMMSLANRVFSKVSGNGNPEDDLAEMAVEEAADTAGQGLQQSALQSSFYSSQNSSFYGAAGFTQGGTGGGGGGGAAAAAVATNPA